MRLRDRRLQLTLAICTAGALGCHGRGPVAAETNRYELRIRMHESPQWVTMVAVTDDRVRQFPGTALENPHFQLRGDRITDELGVEQVACRDGKVFLNGRQVAVLGDGWFEDETTRIAVTADGHATIHRHDEDQAEMLYVGFRPGDICIAALLFYVIPAPRAS